jgi:hypothetical protein
VAELAVTDGMPPPDDLPRGECIVTALPGGGLRVDHADPRILISGEVLDAISRSGLDALTVDSLALNARLDTAGCMPPPWRATYCGAVLHINGVNQQVVYRITGYLPRINAYVGEWPD